MATQKKTDSATGPSTQAKADAPKGKAAGSGGSDIKDAFRAALDRKNANHHPDEDHRDSHGAPPAANDVTKRTFRRKSG